MKMLFWTHNIYACIQKVDANGIENENNKQTNEWTTNKILNSI